MTRQLSVLHSLTDRIVHRKGEELLRAELPPRRDTILKVQLSRLQAELYAAYLQVRVVATGCGLPACAPDQSDSVQGGFQGSVARSRCVGRAREVVLVRLVLVR